MDFMSLAGYIFAWRNERGVWSQSLLQAGREATGSVQVCFTTAAWAGHTLPLFLLLIIAIEVAGLISLAVMPHFT
jgi:hypothetical protein